MTGSCLHCGLTHSFAGRDFCCLGCEQVYGLLHREHLEYYYAVRGERGIPVGAARTDRRDVKWLAVIEERVRASAGCVRVSLDLQGLHCVACVWLIEALFARAPGGRRVVVNPALGRAELVVDRTFDLHAFVQSVESFGYLFGPPVKDEAAAPSRDLLWRLGVCAAIAMNSMIFGIAVYAGLDHGPIFDLFTTLNFAFGAAAVAVGGTVFFRAAIGALRRRVLHLDLPIAIGIALAFLGSAHSYFAHRSKASYFDTLDVFIVLMLLGRWLQERVIEKNRAWLLASDGANGLLARRIEDNRVRLVRCAELRPGDTLLVAPGDLLPVDARVEASRASLSLDWINGESEPRTYTRGELVPAGAFGAGREAIVVRVTRAFEASTLGELLREPPGGPDLARATPWWQGLARLYVWAVLGLAAAGLVGWWIATEDLSRALTVTTAVLIVTCPCAFGIATPLAYELVQAGLRRRGLFVRRSSFLDRARDVERVVLDKTGTLTTGALVLANPQALDRLDEESRTVLYALVSRSTHSKSIAICAALEGRGGVSFGFGACVVDHPGHGLEWVRGPQRWRVGQPEWVAPGAPALDKGDVAFGVDGRFLAGFTTVECLRPDARDEVRALEADGYEVRLLSGDSQERVEAAGRATGLSPGRCLGGQTPHDKARALDRLDRGDTLFVGDGVNDALALDRAHASGTPAVDRPFVPSRADFFFVTAGLGPIRLALRSSHALAQVVRLNLGIALAYNALTVGLALAGRMSPLACAVLMPSSSLTTIAATVAALSSRSRLWKS